jgi:hypothetical protein
MYKKRACQTDIKKLVWGASMWRLSLTVRSDELAEARLFRGQVWRLGSTFVDDMERARERKHECSREEV